MRWSRCRWLVLVGRLWTQGVTCEAFAPRSSPRDRETTLLLLTEETLHRGVVTGERLLVVGYPRKQVRLVPRRVSSMFAVFATATCMNQRSYSLLEKCYQLTR